MCRHIMSSAHTLDILKRIQAAGDTREARFILPSHTFPLF
jgi:hypothetical protein